MAIKNREVKPPKEIFWLSPVGVRWGSDRWRKKIMNGKPVLNR
jgi:hypothetical protein